MAPPPLHQSMLLLGSTLLLLFQTSTTNTAHCAPFLFNIIPVAMAVDRSKFRTCQQTSFCRRHRHGKSKRLYEYRLDAGSVVFHDAGNRNANHGLNTIDNHGGDNHGDNGGNNEKGDASASGGILSSISRRILGNNNNHNNNNNKDMNNNNGDGDPTMRGPSAILTANLINIAPLTSSALTAQTYGGGCAAEDTNSNASSPASFQEELQLSVHLHQDGVARIRITEVLSDGGSHTNGGENVRSTPRWTSDELVLNEEELIAAEDVQIVSVNPLIRAKIISEAVMGDGEEGLLAASENNGEEEKNGEAKEENSNNNYQTIFGNGNKKQLSRKEMETMVSSLAKRASASSSTTTTTTTTIATENYIVLSYGSNTKQNNGDDEWKLVLQLDPFAVYFFRGNDIDNDDTGPPIIAAGTNGLTHFEVRRSKECGGRNDGGGGGNGNGNKRKLTEVKEDDTRSSSEDNVGEENNNEEEEEDGDRHKGKEIVGYWEDGLAIYADGTREERREEETTSSTTNQQEDDDDVDGIDKGEGREHRRLDEEQDFDTEGMWEEKFGDHKDSKPHGPMSVGMELTFPSSQHLFGLPEHASSTQLKTTVGSGGHHYYKEPYRLYNLDVFEYELDETMALYGHIPLVVSQSETMGTAGAFWFNPTETFVDVEETPKTGTKDAESRTHFMSESGIVDLFLLPGPDPAALYGQYARLTGRMPLPPMFSLGYHQCRWNYRDEADVYAVHSKFEELDYPYDVLWLDIEHTDGKRYFTWDDKLFPHPAEMQKKLGQDGRRMVTIIDPHIKRDDKYYIHKEATALGLYVKDKTGGKDYDGWCWPGSSSYLDFTTEKVRSWWADQFHYHKYKGSTPELFTWNDMNEPSVFNGPEVSMQKDLLNLNKCEHREWHNLYGMLFQRSTAEGLTRRNEGENVRPFVLSRSFFAGSQRYGAIWTGDNLAQWSHLEIAAPMLLGLNVGALSFVGADVGGFFGNPDAELMTRWMQAGAYQPFFRGHAHHDAKRREPWMFGDETMVLLRRAAMARYALLPFWYTVFWQAGVTGMPVMRTMWMQYPNMAQLYSVDNQYLIGSDLLVKPVTSPGATTSEVLFPLSDIWYDVDTMQRMQLTGHSNTAVAKVVESGIDKIPVYQRGGSIIPRKLRLRRSSWLMLNDPYTLYVALGESLKAEGTLYMDDETTFDNEKRGDYGIASFSADWGESSIAIQNSVKIGSDDAINAKTKEDRIVERIVIMGVPNEPRGIDLTSSSFQNPVRMEFQYDASSQILIIRKPGVSALDDWSMKLTK